MEEPKKNQWDLSYLLDAEKLLPYFPKVKKVFFFKVCGTGMGSCAVLLKHLGKEVLGADNHFYPPMDQYLRDEQITLLQLDQLSQKDFVEVDLLVVGNAVVGESPLARYIESLKIPFCSFPTLMGSMLKDRQVVGIAGTHGKTTTTYFCSQFFRQLGFDVGHFIGGVIPGEKSAYLGSHPLFFIEADEYDSCYFEKIAKFRLYQLKHLIWTSLEFDHADIYNSVEDIKREFQQLLKQNLLTITYCSDYPEIQTVIENSTAKHLPYGMQSHFGPSDIKIKDGNSHFRVEFQNQKIPIETNLIGKINIDNFSAVLGFYLQNQGDPGKLSNKVISLKLGMRRQEIKGYWKGIMVIDDFAHHPTAVRETLAVLNAKYPKKKILTVFSPTSATARSAIFQTEFAQSLVASDYLIIACSPLKTTVKKMDNLNPEKLLQDWKDFKSNNCEIGRVVSSLNELLPAIEAFATMADIIVVMSNSNALGLWSSSWANTLQSSSA